MVNKMKTEYHNFCELLDFIDTIPANSCAYITLYPKGHSKELFHFEAEDIKNVLLGFIFTIPTLRRELEMANAELGLRVAGEVLSFEPVRREYRKVKFGQNTNEIDQFNEIGGRGWELADCDHAAGCAIFKRQK